MNTIRKILLALVAGLVLLALVRLSAEGVVKAIFDYMVIGSFDGVVSLLVVGLVLVMVVLILYVNSPQPLDARTPMNTIRKILLALVAGLVLLVLAGFSLVGVVNAIFIRSFDGAASLLVIGFMLVVVACFLPLFLFPAPYAPSDNGHMFTHAIARADELIAQGKSDEALPLLAVWTAAAHDPRKYFAAYQRYYPLCPDDERRQRLMDAAAVHDHLPSYTLIQPALERTDPATLPADSILPLAKIALHQGHYPTVLNLTRHFAQNHPGHADTVSVYLLAARALAKTGHTDKARQLLDQLLVRYPAHASDIRPVRDSLRS